MSFKMPTQFIDLPSKGLVYPSSDPLSSGSVELKYPGAAEENIMADESYKEQGIVFDKLFQSVIVSPINYDNLINGDKDQIFLATRILTFGKDYSVDWYPAGQKEPETIPVDLTKIKDKVVDFSKFKTGVNEFDFELPITKVNVTFKLLTHKDEKAIDAEIAGLKKGGLKTEQSASVRWAHTIIAVNGQREQAVVRDFIKNGLITLDSTPLRQYINEISPGPDFKFDYTKPNGEIVEGLRLPITPRFFPLIS